jgi:hypothetical protein
VVRGRWGTEVLKSNGQRRLAIANQVWLGRAATAGVTALCAQSADGIC